ncbi:hypothetical protein G5C66_06355 [Nocardioides sp. KC13]|uniref:Uncharacterized protein n=1 Tax=Nocardioides turkmenicus TaxID=2711220 RepID=A0A6M1QRC7_9ACTN|nr:hypothetical protein [Nocardioides sp. KC13]NGN92363.1 hypothetical protein [Nocardioides sp. KC13]
MGNGDELTVDYDNLNKVHRDLEEQKGLVQSLNLGHAPAVSAFGGSAKGEWLANAVIKGHENIGKAKKETVEGLEKYASAVNDAIHDIAATDEGAAIVAKKMAEALAVMSNPLVIFRKELGGKIPMI